jgi:hypothetical protein
MKPKYANTTQTVRAKAVAISCADRRSRTIEVSGRVFVAAADS